MARTASPARSFGPGKSRVDSFEIISAPPRHPVVRVVSLLLRLRAELFVAAVLVTAWVALGPGQGAGLDSTTRAVVFAAVFALLAGLPWTRRFLFRRAQAVLTRHRVRQALLECRVLNSRSRACPLTLWARPTRVGEVVWLFLRAGLAPKAIEDEADELAAACFAREARVSAWSSMTTLVRVEIIRRDPLAPNLIRSDLFRWAAGDPHDNGWPDPVEGPGPVVAAAGPEPTRPVLPTAGPVIEGPQSGNGRGGDWSDYV